VAEHSAAARPLVGRVLIRTGSSPNLPERWGEQAAAIGMTIEEIVESGKPKGRRGRGRSETSE